jgi:glutamate-1-semialdehyde 2,1-aminomutase
MNMAPEPSVTEPHAIEITDFTRSSRYRAHALRHLANGVSSTARASQLPVPVVIDRAEGARITDLDGNAYIDYSLGYGPMILGHSPAPVMQALAETLSRGLRIATVHEGEAELADLIAACVPSGELSAFVNTGTEAVQLALRIARAATGRVKFVKFRGNYHGWFDNVHVATNPGQDGAATIGQDDDASRNAVVLDWGDADSLERTLTSDFAAVLLEPAAMNAGCFAPPPGFLQRLRTVTQRLGVVLIFDEIITGFRLALGGAQELYGVVPDMTVLGKALGAGLPIGAVCGSRAVMQPVATGKLFQRGTYNGNPISVAASVACVRYLQAERTTVFPRMIGFAEALGGHVVAEAARTGAAVCANQVGPVVQVFGGARRVDRLGDIALADRAQTLAFTAALLRFGVHTIPRGMMYLSAAHTVADIGATKQAITRAMEAVTP